MRRHTKPPRAPARRGEHGPGRQPSVAAIGSEPEMVRRTLETGEDANLFVQRLLPARGDPPPIHGAEISPCSSRTVRRARPIGLTRLLPDAVSKTSTRGGRLVDRPLKLASGAACPALAHADHPP